MARRKSRERSIAPETFLHPINVADFGDPDKDPCFGKLYNLTAPECQVCGDIEFCAVVFAQRQKQKRLQEENKYPIKDLELGELKFNQQVRDYYKERVSEGKKIRALKETSKRFHINIKNLKKIIKNGHEVH